MPLAERSVLPSFALFALARLAGFWAKGPPVVVLLVGVVVVGLSVRWLRPLVAGAAIAAGLGVVAVSVIAFDARQGLGPFFSTYLSKQVLVSVTEGRHHPESNPFFDVQPTLSWYGPAVGALMLAVLALRFRARLSRLSSDVVVLGAALWLGVVVGFSIPVQKVQWYEHPGLVGAALVVGSVLALVPEKLDRLIALACVVVALGWPLITLEPWESRLSQTQSRSPRSSQRPGLAAEMRSPMVRRGIERVERIDPASWRFDGQRVAAP